MGEATAHEVIPDCDDAKLSGLYIMSSKTANFPTLIPNGQYSLLRVSARTSDEILQEVFCCGISGQYDFSAVRSYGNTDSWSPWEYINPPMQLGVEYRTTERFMGSPVYVRLVDFGALPDNTQKDVSVLDAGTMKCGIDLKMITYNNQAFKQYNGITTQVLQNGGITVVTNYNLSNVEAYFLIKYTKTTN